jgi:hypothetical protein
VRVHRHRAVSFGAKAPQLLCGTVQQIRPAMKEISNSSHFDLARLQLSNQFRIVAPIFIRIGTHADHNFMPQPCGLFDRRIHNNAASSESELSYHMHDGA